MPVLLGVGAIALASPQLVGEASAAGASATGAAAVSASAAKSPYYGRWTVEEDNPVFTARGRLYKTIDVAPCGRDFCGVSVDDSGRCGVALFRFMGFPGESPEAKFVEDFMKARLERMEAVLAGREWLAAKRFTVADLLMADVLRQLERFDGLTKYPACRAYVARMTGRPAFAKAYEDQMVHFAAADAA